MSQSLKSILLFTSITCNPAVAQLYKCTVDGKVTYQQLACDGGTSVNTSGAGKAAPNSSSASQAQREIAKYKRQERVDAAIAERKVFIGMTMDEVMLSWGNPSKKNITTTARGSSEQWVYRREDIGRDRYVYVENGVVRTVQSSE